MKGKPIKFQQFVLAAAAIAMLAAPALAQQGQAQNRRVPASAAEAKSSFAPVVRLSAPAVVNVYSERRGRPTPNVADILGGRGGRGGPDGGSDRMQQSLGSGAIVRGDGIIVTNNHVVENSQDIRVVLTDRREFPAKVLLADPRSDLAVLKIEPPAGETFPTIRIDAEEPLQVGDLVLAIGNPYGVGQTVTNGIVSALSRTDIGITDYSFFIQTDAAVNPGNSGGPLVDMDGDLIGVNTAIFSQSGGSSGVSFAIPAALVRQVVASAVAGKTRVERPWLGAQTPPITREAAQNLGLAIAQGVQIKQVYPGGPADKAGLLAGDILLAIDGESVNDESGVIYRIGTRQPNDSVTLKLRRGNADRIVTARLESPPGGEAGELKVSGTNPFNGTTVANLTPALAMEKGIDPFLRGVTVTAVAGTASRNFRAGDVILEINGESIDSTTKLEDILRVGARQWAFTMQRGDQVRRVQTTG